MFLAGSAVDQAAHGEAVGVVVLRDAIGGEAHLVGGGFAFGIGVGLDDARGVADGSGTGRHRLGHHRTRADLGPGSDRESAQHARMRTDDDPLLQRRVALGALGQRGAAQGHALIDGAVIPHFGHFTDHDAHAVVDEDTVADLGAGVDLDAGKPAAPVRDPAGQPGPATAPAAVRDAMQYQGVEARIGKHHIPLAARGRVAFEDALDVGLDTGKHGTSVAGAGAPTALRVLECGWFSAWPAQYRAGCGFLPGAGWRGGTAAAGAA